MFGKIRLCAFCLAVTVCLTGCSSGKLAKVTDCTDFWRIDNCFVFDPVRTDPARKAARHRQKQAENAFYKSYKPQKLVKPAKTFGDRS